MLIRVIITLLKLYYFLIIVRILLSWIPIDRNNQFVSQIHKLTDPYLNLFRKIIPPVGMMDFSPIVALIVLDIIKQLIYKVI